MKRTRPKITHLRHASRKYASFAYSQKKQLYEARGARLLVISPLQTEAWHKKGTHEQAQVCRKRGWENTPCGSESVGSSAESAAPLLISILEGQVCGRPEYTSGDPRLLKEIEALA